MTAKEAISILELHNPFLGTDKKLTEAFDMAIKALTAQQWMPSLVQGICRSHLEDISDKDLYVMIEDCKFQKDMDLYGDERIDKPNWLKWHETLLAEKKRREGEQK